MGQNSFREPIEPIKKEFKIPKIQNRSARKTLKKDNSLPSVRTRNN